MAIVNWSNVTAFEQIPSVANTATNSTFWPGMLFMIWVILILVMIPFGWVVALLASSFIGLLLGIILVYAGLIGWTTAMIFAGILFFLFLYISFRKGRQR